MKSIRAAIPILSALLLGNPTAHADDVSPGARQAIPVTAAEHDYLLTEMHHNLEALGATLAALSRNDTQEAARAAATRGLASYGDRDPNRPKSLSAALPPGWKPMAMQLRASFDELAAGISSHEPTAQSLGRVATITALCNGCHSAYRLVRRD